MNNQRQKQHRKNVTKLSVACILVLATLWAMPLTWAAEEAPAYYFNKRDVPFYFEGGERKTNTFLLAKTKAAPECRPAALDAEGNWGPPQDGGQLGVRFSKAVFTNGEAITAAFYMRNIGDGTLSYLSSGPSDRSFGIVVFKEGGSKRVLTRIEENDIIHPGTLRMSRSSDRIRDFSVQIGMQDQQEVSLTRLYDLSRPGRYYISGTVAIDRGTNLSKGSISSGTAMIEILPLPKQPKATDAQTGSSQKVNLVVAPGQSVSPKVGNDLTFKGNSATSPNEVAAATSQPRPLVAKEEASEPRQPAEEHSSPQRSGNGTRVMALWSGLGLLCLIAISWFLLRRKTAQ